MSSLRHKFRFIFVMVAFQAPSISSGFDVSFVYPTNDWPVASYERLVIPGETISLFNSTFTNLSDSSPFVELSDDGDFLVADVVSGGRFRVRVNVENSPEQARERMMDHFSMCAAIQPFPRLVLDGRELGDRAYKGWGTNAVNSASFVRNNVFVDLFADQESSTVVPLAMLLDDAVLVLSGVSEPETRRMSGEQIKSSDANLFLDRIGIARGSSVSLTNQWTLPQSVLVSNLVVYISGERQFNHFSGILSDTNSIAIGTFEADVSDSEAGARTYWGMRQTSRPLPPHLYYNSYEIDERSGGVDIPDEPEPPERGE